MFPRRCPPALKPYENEYQKIIRDANRFQRKRLFVITLLFFLAVASLLFGIGGMITCIALGVNFKIVGLAIGGGIACPLIGIPTFIVAIYFSVSLSDKIYKEYKEFMEKQNYEIPIKIETETKTYYRKGKKQSKSTDVIVFTIPISQTEKNKV